MQIPRLGSLWTFLSRLTRFWTHFFPRLPKSLGWTPRGHPLYLDGVYDDVILLQTTILIRLAISHFLNFEVQINRIWTK